MLWCIFVALRARTFFFGKPFPLDLGYPWEEINFVLFLCPGSVCIYALSFLDTFASDTETVSMPLLLATETVSMPLLLAWCFLFTLVSLVQGRDFPLVPDRWSVLNACVSFVGRVSWHSARALQKSFPWVLDLGYFFVTSPNPRGSWIVLCYWDLVQAFFWALAFALCLAVSRG